MLLTVRGWAQWAQWAQWDPEVSVVREKRDRVRGCPPIIAALGQAEVRAWMDSLTLAALVCRRG